MATFGRIHAEAIFAAALDAVRPKPLVEQALATPELQSETERANRVIVVGGGKAGAGMVAGVESALAARISAITGVVNVPDDAWQPTHAVRLQRARPIGVNEPTEAALHGAEEMLALARSATDDDVVLALLSGGGSALLPAMADGISLQDKVAVTRLLSAAGASIQELNCVRKHLSRIKGGQLAVAAAGAGSMWSLIISDVVGNPLDVIASGPTVPDPTTFADAMAVVDKYHLANALPPAVIARLVAGVAGKVPETPKTIPANVHNCIIATNADALMSAISKARALGYEVLNLGDAITGDTTEVAKRVSAYIPDKLVDRPLCILIGGETTVSLGGSSGKGGRNQEFVLALATQLEYLGGNPNRITILSGGTDGEDGPTDAAGAVCDFDVLQDAIHRGLNPQDYLRTHASYLFFQLTGGLIKTGFTGTNVMDVRLVLIGDVST